ncbi:hypothetical protein [Oceanobacillus sp. Castelsardo]|uniref:hypothetical protein n=1 Tax=Oceanobacillus sp. Castelsardo TaxID=1851204 RepID=UPI00083809A0|nr:hypothetical protein [Oceanobacillus sp. Castelsardo]
MTFLKLILITLLTIQPTLTANGLAKEKDAVIINTYQADVTGDGLLEDIDLMGVPFSNSGDYYHNVWAEVKSKNRDNERWQINYGDGYEPQIQFIDANHDNVQDILYQSSSDKKHMSKQKLHTFASNKLFEISLPKLDYVSGKFADDYRADLKITPNAKPIQINLQNHSDTYIQSGVYSIDGKLKKSKSLLLNAPHYYEVVKLTDDKGYGLRSYKRVSGISNEDHLGTIESLWYYTDGKWIVLQSEWKDSNRLD